LQVIYCGMGSGCCFGLPNAVGEGVPAKLGASHAPVPDVINPVSGSRRDASRRSRCAVRSGSCRSGPQSGPLNVEVVSLTDRPVGAGQTAITLCALAALKGSLE
jgi:hypothetical protein